MKAILPFAIILLTSCVSTVLPDGSVQTAPDYNAWIEVARMVREDHIPPVVIVEPSKK